MMSAAPKNLENYHLKPVLGVDYGTKVTGLAFFCPGREPFPLPFGQLNYSDDQKLARDIKQVVDDEAIELVVLGLPLFTDGKESDMTARVRQFSTLLESMLGGIELKLQDETLTSYEAADRMKNSAQYNFKVDESKIDALAASIILEDFFRQ